MNYFLLKLAFKGPVHFGGGDSAMSLQHSEDHFCGDTLFSALCHAALQREGEEGLHQLVSMAQEGAFLLSDGMPWCGAQLYLPKPMITGNGRREIPAEQRKTVKKLAWIPVLEMKMFCESLCGGEPYNAEAESFGIQLERTVAKLTYGEDALPYQVGLYQFRENCGLYVILATEQEEQAQWITLLMERLGLSGIGGKTSAGYGRFEIVDTIKLNASPDDQTRWIYHALQRKEGRQLLLTTSLPKDAELEQTVDDAYYQLVRRGGFVASDTYAETARKKRTQYFLAAGAVLTCRFQGDVYDVGQGAGHPVYRYGKPLLLGVDL